MRPHIIVNARFLTQPLTGVQRYAHELASRLSGATLLTPDAPRGEYNVRGLAITRRGGLRGHLWEQLELPNYVPRGSVLFCPSGSGPVHRGRHVLTIHDLALFEHSGWYSLPYVAFYRTLLPRMCEAARQIVTVSQFNRERLINLLRVPNEKITVIPEAADKRFRRMPRDEVAELLAELGIREPYVFAVGAVSRRKNFARLFEAWLKVSETLRSVKLVVAGREGLRFAGGRNIGALPQSVRFLGAVSDRHLVALYNGALAFLYPSVYEGFGLPVLEAMACGTPVVTSNVTAMPEVAGDAAVFCNPLEVTSIAASVLAVCCDAGLRSRLTAAGLARSAQFSWESTAHATVAVLNKV